MAYRLPITHLRHLRSDRPSCFVELDFFSDTEPLRGRRRNPLDTHGLRI